MEVKKYMRDWPTSRDANAQGSSSVSQLSLTRTNSSAEFLLESAKHEMSRTLLSHVFK